MDEGRSRVGKGSRGYNERRLGRAEWQNLDQ